MLPMTQAIPKVVADLMRRSPHSPAKIDFAWKAVVGPAIARVTFVRLEGTTLIVEAETAAWRNEIVRSSGLLLARFRHLFGSEAITEISVRA